MAGHFRDRRRSCRGHDASRHQTRRRSQRSSPSTRRDDGFERYARDTAKQEYEDSILRKNNYLNQLGYDRDWVLQIRSIGQMASPSDRYLIDYLARYLAEQLPVQELLTAKQSQVFLLGCEKADNTSRTAMSGLASSLPDILKKSSGLRDNLRDGAGIVWFCDLYDQLDCVEVMVRNLIGQLLDSRRLSLPIPTTPPPRDWNGLLSLLSMCINDTLERTSLSCIIDSYDKYEGGAVGAAFEAAENMLKRMVKESPHVHSFKLMLTTVGMSTVRRVMENITRRVILPQTVIEDGRRDAAVREE